MLNAETKIKNGLADMYASPVRDLFPDMWKGRDGISHLFRLDEKDINITLGEALEVLNDNVHFSEVKRDALHGLSFLAEDWSPKKQFFENKLLDFFEILKIDKDEYEENFKELMQLLSDNGDDIAVIDKDTTAGEHIRIANKSFLVGTLCAFGNSERSIKILDRACYIIETLIARYYRDFR